MSQNEKFLAEIVKICDQKKAQNIKAYQFKDFWVVDYAVIATANNAIQVKAVVGDLLVKFKKQGVLPNMSGKPDSGWVILDFNSIMVHIFVGELREYYQLDRLFEKRAVVFHY
jgi:ribosome-associated protein